MMCTNIHGDVASASAARGKFFVKLECKIIVVFFSDEIFVEFQLRNRGFQKTLLNMQ